MKTNVLAIARVATAVVLLGAAGFVTACSDDVAGPDSDETGAAEAYVQDRPGGGGEAASHLWAGNSRTRTAAQNQAAYSGTMNADAQVGISADGETWIDLGPPASASVDLQVSGDGANVHGQAEVPVGTYSRVRLVLTGAEAVIGAGSTIGGISLTADVTMTLGADGNVTIVKEVPPFEVRADTRTRIFWDLNSHLWVNEENVEEEEVEEEEVEESSEPRTESGPRDQEVD